MAFSCRYFGDVVSIVNSGRTLIKVSELAELVLEQSFNNNPYLPRRF